MLGLGLGVDKIRPVTAGGLLDLYPATAAYSLRALSSTTTNVVRVREDGSNTEQDFTAKEITDGTLASFCGANNGFVVTWYDQAGSNDATQATAGSQPKIYDSSTGVVLENGNPAVDFDGVDDFLNASTINIPQPTSYFITYRYRDISDINKTDIIDSDVSRQLIDVSNGNILRIFAGSNFISSVNGVTTQALRFSLFNSTSSAIAVNGGAAEVGNAGTNAIDNMDIGKNINNNKLDATLQEIIIYSSDQSANRTAIESNINSHYSIYP